MVVRSYYKVTVQSLTLQGANVGTSFGETIVDSGTTYTYFPTRIYRKLKQEAQMSDSLVIVIWLLNAGASQVLHPHASM